MSVRRLNLRLARIFYIGDWIGSMTIFALVVYVYGWIGLSVWFQRDVLLVWACVATIWGGLPLLLEIYREISDKRTLSAIYRALWFAFMATFCLAGCVVYFQYRHTAFANGVFYCPRRVMDADFACGHSYCITLVGGWQPGAAGSELRAYCRLWPGWHQGGRMNYNAKVIRRYTWLVF
jgi:hypothetical protein